jgi:hypothetical protein
MFGRIQKQSGDCVKAFINLCCKYWHELGQVCLDDARLDFGATEIDALIKSKVIKNEAGMIRIDFLDEQLDEIKAFSGAQRVRGLKSAEARAAKKKSTTVEPKSTTVQPPFNKSQPIRREEIIGDKKRRERHALSFSESFTQIESIQRLLKNIGQPHDPENVLKLLDEFDPTFYVTHPNGDFQKYCYRFLDFVKDYNFNNSSFVTPNHEELWS